MRVFSVVWLAVFAAAGADDLYPRPELPRPAIGEECWLAVPLDDDGTGRFELPEAWGDRRLHLHVEGRDRGAKAPSVNARQLTAVDAAPGRESYELADALELGREQVLRVEGGGTAWVEPVGESLVIDAFASPDVAAGAVTVHVSAELDGTALLRIGVADAKGREVAAATLGLTYGGADTGIAQFLPTAVQLPLPNPHLWSPEDPYRYTLRIELKREDEVLDIVEAPFGMRDVEFRGDRLVINGVESAGLKGVDRAGAVTDSSPSEIKGMGFDLVRVLGGSAPAAFYDECDRVGLLVCQELQAGDGAAMRSTFTQLRRHPSLVLWQPEPQVEPVYRWLRRNDPARPTVGGEHGDIGLGNKAKGFQTLEVDADGDGYLDALEKEAAKGAGVFVRLGEAAE